MGLRRDDFFIFYSLLIICEEGIWEPCHGVRWCREFLFIKGPTGGPGHEQGILCRSRLSTRAQRIWDLNSQIHREGKTLRRSHGRVTTSSPQEGFIHIKPIFFLTIIYHKPAVIGYKGLPIYDGQKGRRVRPGWCSASSLSIPAKQYEQAMSLSAKQSVEPMTCGLKGPKRRNGTA
jgi:hypothetical protein